MGDKRNNGVVFLYYSGRRELIESRSVAGAGGSVREGCVCFSNFWGQPLIKFKMLRPKSVGDTGGGVVVDSMRELTRTGDLDGGLAERRS